ncbi:putative lipoprotein [Lysobacter antibioticus]|uniref:Metallo-beta-lactamase superfamily protein n=1 Tax=Lysobacter antibioticus TaxID=84531 RepID=A0A0S2E4D8_LYSAN|nr:hypothetical protein [Lysobacter antibioticus]ALN65670.1 putative lipoprotein [Lysobacter antibioticus]ALN81436.1 hypothetical protein LA76x_3310 [Lysobacter antibioticus]
MKRPIPHLSACFIAVALAMTSGCASLPSQPVAESTSEVGTARKATAEIESRFASVASQGTGTIKPKRRTNISFGMFDASSLPPKRVDQLRIHFLPVGTGSCQIVECPGSGALPLLIDCGSKGSAHYDVETTREYLQGIIGDGKVHVVVSHPDDDHVNWIHKVITPEQVRSLWVGDDYVNYKEPFLAWVTDIMDMPAGDRGTVYDTLGVNWSNNGEAVADLACGVADTYVLGVNNGTTSNAKSLMLAIQFGAFSATFTGDATGASEAAAITNYPDALESTVLAASHHGAETENSNSQEWADATRPAYVVYSAGSHANFRHPRCSAVATYRGAGELRQVGQHQLQCGEANGWKQMKTSLSEYSTNSSGLIVITAGKSSSNVSIYCGKGNCE